MKNFKLKKVAVLLVAAVFVFSGLFASGFALSKGNLPASLNDNIVPTHAVEANFSVTNLPRRVVMMGVDPIGIPRRNYAVGDTTPMNLRSRAYFVIVRPGIGNDTIIARSHGPNALAENTPWPNAGTFEYRFFATVEDVLHGDLQNWFETHSVTVEANEFTFVLPTNSGYFHTNNDGAVTDITPDFIPNIAVVNQPITAPFPTSFYDRRGRDLFSIRRNDAGELYVPYINHLRALYPTLSIPAVVEDADGNRVSGVDAGNDFEMREFLMLNVFRNTNISFFGNDGREAERPLIGWSMTGEPATQSAFDTAWSNGEITRLDQVQGLLARRTFIPRRAANNYYFEYSFDHPEASATFRTQNIVVENVGSTYAAIMGRTTDPAPRDAQIRLDLSPTVSFQPTNLRMNIEATLPNVTVHLSDETDRDSLSYSPVDFRSGVEQLTAFTFVRIEFLPDDRPTGAAGNENGPNGWRVATDPEGNPYSHVTDFRFIPMDFFYNHAGNRVPAVGQYRFTYFVTTIFGAGYDHSTGRDRVVSLIPGGVGYTETHVNAQQTFIRFTLPEQFFVRADNVAPEVQWTDANFIYDQHGHPIRLDRPIVWSQGTTGDYSHPRHTDARPVALSGERLLFSEAPDRSQMLPGSGRNSRTQVATAPVTGANPALNANRLSLPALLSTDNITPAGPDLNAADPSRTDIVHTITLRRTIEGQTYQPTINFRSNVGGRSPAVADRPNAPGHAYAMRTWEYKPWLPLEFHFGDNPNPSQSGSGTWFRQYNPYAPAGAWRGDAHWESISLGTGLVGFYDIQVVARDRLADGSQGLMSQTLMYSFHVVSPLDFRMHTESPVFHGGIQLRGNSLYEGDTLSFREVAPSDDFTDDRNIDVQYYLVFNSNVSSHPNNVMGNTLRYERLTDADINISGGNVHLELTRETANSVADRLIRSIPTSSTSAGILSVQVVAVARNFFAMQQGSTFNAARFLSSPRQDQDAGIMAIGTTFRLISLTFGEAATIQGTNLQTSTPSNIQPWNWYTPTPLWEMHSNAAGDDVWTRTPANRAPIENGWDARARWEMNLLDANRPHHSYVNDSTRPGSFPATTAGAAGEIQTVANRDNHEFRQFQRIDLPQIAFGYSGTNQLSTAISYTLIEPISGRRIGVQPSSMWSGQVPLQPNAADNRLWLGTGTPNSDTNPTRYTDPTRYFIPQEVGDYRLIVTATNLGGNITVFSATIRVVGVPQYTITTQGGSQTARVGQTAFLPTVVITVNGRQFRTNEYNQIVTDFQNDLTYQGAFAGTYTITGRSENGDTVDMSNIDFLPTTSGRFVFEFHVVITAARLAQLGLMTQAGSGVDAIRTFAITVDSLDDNDMDIEVWDDDYQWLQRNMGQGARAQVWCTETEQYIDEYYPDGETPRFLEAGHRVWDDWNVRTGTSNANEVERLRSQNILYQMIGGTQPTDFTFAVSDQTLHNGLVSVPVADAGNEERVFQYGLFYLPRFSAALDTENVHRDFLGHFNDHVYTRTTVRGPRARAGEYLLDTSDPQRSNSHFVNINGSYQEMFYFQPLGRLQRSETRNADGEFTYDRFGDQSLFADGEYVITFTATFDGVTTTLTFRVLLGDTNVPRIHFANQPDHDFLFGTTHTVGDLITISTLDLQIDPSGGRTNFTPRFVAENMDVIIRRPSDNATLGSGNYTADGHLVRRFPAPGADVEMPADMAAMRPAEIWDLEDWWVQEWSFELLQAGRYQVEIRISSESGMPATFIQWINVEEEPDRARIAPAQVWGIILIVLASGVALAVLIYFIKTRPSAIGASGGKKDRKGKGKSEVAKESGEIATETAPKPEKPEKTAKRKLNKAE